MDKSLGLLVASLCSVALSGCGGNAVTSSSPSNGCTNPTLAPGVTNGTIDVAGRTRTYVQVVPEGAATIARALVFGFHWLGGDGAGIRGYLGLEAPAGGAAIFVYPDGLETDGRTGWPNTDDQDIAFFDALLAKISSEACVDMNRVFAAGFSAGGGMSNTVGCERAGVVRGIAPLSGRGPWTTCNEKQVAAWLSFGSSDSYYDEASRDHWLETNHCATTSEPVTPSPCVTYDGCDRGYPVTWCKFDGSHEVPSWVGPAVWRFFDEL